MLNDFDLVFLCHYTYFFDRCKLLLALIISVVTSVDEGFQDLLLFVTTLKHMTDLLLCQSPVISVIENLPLNIDCRSTNVSSTPQKPQFLNVNNVEDSSQLKVRFPPAIVMHFFPIFFLHNRVFLGCSQYLYILATVGKFLLVWSLEIKD